MSGENGPRRIQRSRATGWRMPEGAVYVGRPTRWGNPFTVAPAPNWPRWAGPRPSVVLGPNGERWDPPDSRRVIVGRAAAERSSRMMAAQMAVDMYRELVTRAHMSDDFLTALAGRNLACWCPLDQPCHADVLLQLAGT